MTATRLEQPRALVGRLAWRALPHLDSEGWVLVCVSIITAYLVLPPLFSVVQTSLFTTKISGELDEFMLKYYAELLL